MDYKKFEMENNKFALENFIDIGELIDVLWKGKFLIIIVTSIFAISSVYYALSLTNIYRSSSVLTLSDDSNSGQSLASKYSGLASLAGINIGSASADKSDWAIEKIKSRDFLLNLINNDKEIVPALMAADNYDKYTKEFSYNNEIYDVESDSWVEGEPHYQDVWSIYNSKLYISKSKETGFISISFDHLSPFYAQKMLENIINSINQVAKDADIKGSNQAFNYLMQLSPTIKNTNVKDSLDKVLEEQLRIKMFSNIKDEYLFKMIEPPFAPINKFKPSRAIICIMGTLFGGFISVLIVLFRRYFIKTADSLI